MTGKALELEGVGRRGDDRWLLHDVTVRAERGEIVHIAGPSGSGKTTLLRLLARLDEAQSGEVRILGRSITEWPVRELRRTVGLVPQEPFLLPGTVEDNLRSAERWAPTPRARSRTELEAALAVCGLEGAWLDRVGDVLSRGERQRVALARTLLMEPSILVLDEPTSALDPMQARQLGASLLGWARERQATLVQTSHRFEEIRRLGGSLWVLVEGELVETGSVPDVLDAPRTRAAQVFFSEPEPEPTP